MSIEIANKLTPITPNEALLALTHAYHEATGAPPTRAVSELLLAHFNHETGKGKSVHNFNMGNKKSVPSDMYHQYFGCWEMVDGQRVDYPSGHSSCRFAAYRTLEQAAAAHIALMASRPHWWAGLHSGSAAGFAAGLSQKPAYFTADPGRYAAALGRHLPDSARRVNVWLGERNNTAVLLSASGLAVMLYFAFRAKGMMA